MIQMTPFKDENVVVCGPDNGITIENGDVINIYGDIQISEDTTKGEVNSLIRELEKIRDSLKK